MDSGEVRACTHLRRLRGEVERAEGVAVERVAVERTARVVKALLKAAQVAQRRRVALDAEERRARLDRGVHRALEHDARAAAVGRIHPGAPAAHPARREGSRRVRRELQMAGGEAKGRLGSAQSSVGGTIVRQTGERVGPSDGGPPVRDRRRSGRLGGSCPPVRDRRVELDHGDGPTARHEPPLQV